MPEVTTGISAEGRPGPGEPAPGPRGARPPAWALGLVGLILASAGMALFYGSTTPAYYPADERAHAAYADALRAGTLPDVDTLQAHPPPGRPPGEPARPDDYVYVANHPPLFAGAQALLAAGLERSGIEPATVVAGRLLNSLATVAAVVAVALLGRDLTGSPGGGLWSATLFAALPLLWSVASFGYGDGAAVAATALVALAGVRAWRRPGWGPWLALGGAAALAGLVRASALAAAVAVGVLVVARAVAGPPAGSTAPRAGLASATATGGPPLVLAGWWYLRNWQRFGDPVASTVLNERLGRQPHPGGVLGRLVDLEQWRVALTEVVGSVYAAVPGSPRPRLSSGVLAVVGSVALLAGAGLVLRWVRTRRSGPEGGGDRRGWPVVVAAAAAVVLGTAQHVAAGGAPHPRYLLPALAVLAPLVVVGLDAWHRIVTALAGTGMAAASLVLMVRARAWIEDEADRFGLVPIGPDPWRAAAAALVAVGLALAGAALLVGAERTSLRRGGEG